MNGLDKSDCVVIVLHEIYGVNKNMLKVCEYYKDRGFNVICPNLLNLDSPFDYVDEEKAYKYFMDKVGFDAASKKVMDIIAQGKQKYKKVFLIGFSIGATVAWMCSEKEPKCDGVIGYYGSRIRKYTDIIPKCKTLLIFATEEKGFSAMELVHILEEKENTEVHILPGKHGFNDSFSNRYFEESYEEALKLVNKFLHNLIKGKLKMAYLK